MDFYSYIMNIPQQKNYRGFTIVELLVVIVVIGVLVSIAIVAYNGITQRSTAAMISNDLSNATNRLKLDQVDLSGAFPPSVAAANGGQGLQSSSGDTYQYSVNNSTNPGTFCLTASNNSTSYFVTQNSGTATIGACPGHAVGGPPTITNLMPNPGIEVDASNWTNPNGSTIARDTSISHSGIASLKVTMPATTSTLVGSGYLLGSTAVPSILAINTTYTFSVWVYVPAATTTAIISTVQGTGYTSRVNGSPSVTNVKDTWVRLTNSFTTGTSGNVNLYFINASTTTAGQIFYIDDAMLTIGTNVYNYADGSYSINGWNWTGATGVTTSIGPVL